MNRPLSEAISISRHFLRSVRIDMDYGREDALQGYICQGTARRVLENVAKQLLDTNQRAFTWTGPYGGGKSSLALALCSLVGSDPSLRSKAAQVLGISDDDPLRQAFPTGQDGWLVIPVVGRRGSFVEGLSAAISKAAGFKLRKNASASSVLSCLTELAEARRDNGVLLIIDEFGKFLEEAARLGEDIYFFQELAEAASRIDGRLVVIGVLHQAFEQYAARLGREVREEWAKIQGRFIDVPLVAASDEVIALIGRAIEGNAQDASAFKKAVETVASSIRARRPGAGGDLDEQLLACWPLHPVTAALLGPISKRKFGQNERSTFGFLASAEPLGFGEFLVGHDVAENSLYSPARYWDYLRANLEPAILSSPDGHRWATAVEAVERAEARGSALHVALTKAVALIDMFRNGSGLAADDDVLAACVEDSPPKEVVEALSDLRRWAILIYRKHLDAWGAFSGSDFDIDAAVVAARNEIPEVDLGKLTSLSEMTPVLAKRHYQKTGAMRWLTRTVVPASRAKEYINKFNATSGSCGEFVLVLNNTDVTRAKAERLASELSEIETDWPVLVGVPAKGERIVELALELSALEHISKTRGELQGDSVARREISSRLTDIRSELEEVLRDAFLGSGWFYQGESVHIEGKGALSRIASKIADEVYPSTPHLFSELINRQKPSSNSVKARRDLLHRMLTRGGEENLGYEGFPADAGLYFTLIKTTGIHQNVNGGWRFGPPNESSRGQSLKALWDATRELVSVPDKQTSLEEIFDLWRNPPFGAKDGVMPVLAFAYFVANRHQLALYADNVFIPDVTDAHVDELTQDPQRIGFRFVELAEDRQALLNGLSDALARHLGRAISPEPLDTARALVALIFNLPGWTKRTSTVSPIAQEVRRLVLKASDPHRVLFEDVPLALRARGEGDVLQGVTQVVGELLSAYGKMLDGVKERFLAALGHEGDLDDVRRRAEIVRGISGDFKLDAFASRLQTFQGTPADMERVMGLAVTKSARDWVDRDVDAAIIQLGSWAMEFRRVEAIASLRGRPSTRRAIAVIFGGANGRETSVSFDIAESDFPAVENLSQQIVQMFRAGSTKREVLLAALAEAGAVLADDKEA